MSIKRRIFETIQPDQGDSIASRIFDWSMTVLIFASVVSVFVQTFDLPADVSETLSCFEAFSSLVFTIEYAFRIWTADLLYPGHSFLGSRLRYVASGMAIVDLLAILPFWLPMFLPGSMLGMRALRHVRLLRIFKLNRYFDAVKSIGDVIASKKRELLGSFMFVILLMLVSSLLMYSVEHDAQPDVFQNAFSGLWWAVATLTTVGYGDIYPITGLGRLLGAVIAFSGIAALAIPTGIVTAGLTERIGHGKAVQDELVRQRGRDDAHDAELARQRAKHDELAEILKRQDEMLKAILAELSKRRGSES